MEAAKVIVDETITVKEISSSDLHEGEAREALGLALGEPVKLDVPHIFTTLLYYRAPRENTKHA